MSHFWLWSWFIGAVFTCIVCRKVHDETCSVDVVRLWESVLWLAVTLLWPIALALAGLLWLLNLVVETIGDINASYS